MVTSSRAHLGCCYRGNFSAASFLVFIAVLLSTHPSEAGTKPSTIVAGAKNVSPSSGIASRNSVVSPFGRSLMYATSLKKIRGGSSFESINDSAIDILPSTTTSSIATSPPPIAKSTSTPPPPPQPSLLQIRNFALPCLALWTSASILSLVDTAFIGLSAEPGTGASQLGALGPATNTFDGATYLFAFLNVATTNLYAGVLAEAKQRGSDGTAEGECVVRVSTKIAAACGLAVAAFVLTCGEAWLGLFVGGAENPDIVENALSYVRVRALSLPTTLLYGVWQAALLGAKDSVTPLIAVAVSTVVNVVGDGICVWKLKMGLRGAAIATLAAQLCGTAAVLGPARKKLFVAKEKLKERATKAGDVTGMAFLGFAAPVLTLILGKIVIFGLMTHVAAALRGDATLAAHQIVLSFFFCVSPCLEVISQTAQTFLPQYFTLPSNLTKSDKVEYNAAANKLTLRLLILGGYVASACAGISAGVTRFFPHFLTRESSVQSAVKPLSVPLALGALLTAPVAVSEGVLLAKRDLGYLAGVYVLTTALLPPFLFRLKSAPGASAVNVWMFFVLFQLVRAVLFTGRLWWNKDGNSIDAEEEKASLEKVQ